MKKWLVALIPLGLSGCAGFLVEQGINGALAPPGIAHYQSAYKAYYAKSDCSAVLTGLSSWETTASILLVDSQPTDDAGFPYWYFCYSRIFVRPGPHRFVVKILQAGRTIYSVMDVDVMARRVYRLTAIKRDNENVLQLWDETEGADRRTLLTEVPKPPAAYSFDEAVRAFKVNSDSAVVIGDSPRRFNGLGEEYVYFSSIDGLEINEPGYPIEMFQMRFLPAGTHRIGARVEGTGLFPGLDIRTLPEMEVALIAEHFYRVAAKKVGNQVLVQFWDETEGGDKRTLVKELLFGDAKT